MATRQQSTHKSKGAHGGSHARSAKSHGRESSVAHRGHIVQGSRRASEAGLERSIERGASRMKAALRRWPYVGVAGAAAIALVAADAIGVGEVALAGVVGYVAFRALKQRAGVGEAVEEGLHAAGA